jgi:GGDEF domain-containing protein
MEKRFLRIAAILCASAYAFAVGTAIYRIMVRDSALERIAEKEFGDLVDRASAAAALGFLDAPFREAIRSSVETSQTLAAAIVTGPNGPEYAVEREGGFLAPMDGSPRFAQRIDVAPSPLVAPLRVETARNATVSVARLRTFPDELFFTLRDSLLMTLVPMAGAILLLLNASGDADRTAARITRKSEDKPSDSIKPPPEVPSFKVRSFEDEFDIPEIAEDLKNQQDGDGGNTFQESDREKPSGLFSPRSNLGWENYLKERLSSELHRAASFEQDLVLAFLELSGPEAEARFKEFADEVVGFFSFRDLAFEYGGTGAAVILPNINLDHGLQMADSFVVKKHERFADLTDGSGALIRIGLSARSGRLVEADRLIAEGVNALKRAREDAKTPIVAFKPDLERYRSFIRTRA